MSQILMVFNAGTPLFRRAGHLRLAVEDECTLFGGDDGLVLMTVTHCWTLLTLLADIELLELDWVDGSQPKQLEILSRADFSYVSTSDLTHNERVVIKRLLRQLRVSDSDDDTYEAVADLAQKEEA